MPVILVLVLSKQSLLQSYIILDFLLLQRLNCFSDGSDAVSREACKLVFIRDLVISAQILVPFQKF